MTHFGSHIWSYTRRRAGACRSVMVPTMIKRSAWRGEKRGNSAPKRAMSYFGAATDMNSMPQHAVTNGYVNSENFRPQFAASSRRVVASSSDISIPPDRLLAPYVGQGYHQDRDEDEHLGKSEHAGLAHRAGREVAVEERPRVHEGRFDVEDEEEDCYLVETDRVAT